MLIYLKALRTVTSQPISVSLIQGGSLIGVFKTRKLSSVPIIVNFLSIFSTSTMSVLFSCFTVLLWTLHPLLLQEVSVMDLSSFEFGMVHCQIQGDQDENIILVAHNVETGQDTRRYP